MNNTKKTIFAKDVMRSHFLKIDGISTVKEAIEQMKAANVTVIIVNKRHQHDEYGIVLLSDIAKRVLAKDRSPERVNIYEIMTKPVVSVPPDMDVRYCARLFEQFGLSLAPVLDNGEIIGTVDYYDLVMEGFLHNE